MDQAGRPLPPKSLSIFVGLTLKLDSLCIIVNVVENIWTFWFVFNIFGFGSLKSFDLVGIGRNDSKYPGWSLIVMKCALYRNVPYAEKNCRNRNERVRGFRKIVAACLL